MNHILLRIIYSIDFEIERVSETLKRFEWYKTHGYSVKLPKSLDLSDHEKISREDIEKAVREEYDEKKYLESKEYLENNWGKVSSKLIKGGETLLFPFQEQYDVCFTMYGVGGSYRLPNKIIVNIQSKFEFGLLRTIVHEIIHLLIGDAISRHKVEHWAKERIVDLLISRVIPEMSKIQQVPIDTRAVDEIFKNNYPDINLVVKLVSEKEQ